MISQEPIELCSNIQETYNLDPIIESINLTDQDTLVIFDIDDVLIISKPEDDLRHPYRAQLLKAVTENLNSAEIENIHSIILAKRDAILIDPNIHTVFELLSKKQIPTIALTGMGTGKFGIINSMEELRHTELNKLGISFSRLTPFKGRKIVDKLDLSKITLISNVIIGMPCLDLGIIFTSGLDKGPILEFMLSEFNYYPEKIIFVDDLLPNLGSIQVMAKKLKIHFQGFCYKGAAKIPLPTIDQKLEKIRFSILKEKHLWLNYEQLNNLNQNI